MRRHFVLLVAIALVAGPALAVEIDGAATLKRLQADDQVLKDLLDAFPREGHRSSFTVRVSQVDPASVTLVLVGFKQWVDPRWWTRWRMVANARPRFMPKSYRYVMGVPTALVLEVWDRDTLVGSFPTEALSVSETAWTEAGHRFTDVPLPAHAPALDHAYEQDPSVTVPAAAFERATRLIVRHPDFNQADWRAP